VSKISARNSIVEFRRKSDAHRPKIVQTARNQTKTDLFNSHRDRLDGVNSDIPSISSVCLDNYCITNYSHKSILWISILYWKLLNPKRIWPHLFGKIKVSKFDLKFCLHQGLNQTTLSTKFQNFRADYLRDMNFFKISIKKRLYANILISRR
jgi:hypothetical protein